MVAAFIKVELLLFAFFVKDSRLIRSVERDSAVSGY